MKNRWIGLTLLFLLGAGCASPSTPSTPPAIRAHTDAWVSIAPDLDRLQTSDMILFRFAAGKFSWQFAASDKPTPVGTWAADFPNAVAVMNGVYFREDFSPAGYLVDDGKMVGSSSFDEDKSGYIELAPKVAIVHGQEALDKHANEVGQSYPFLIDDGQAAVAADSGQMARRSFIGLDRQGNVYLGIIADDEVSLFVLAQELAGLKVDWTNVINLDGGPSSGLVVSAGDQGELIDSFVPVPNVIVAERLE